MRLQVGHHAVRANHHARLARKRGASQQCHYVQVAHSRQDDIGLKAADKPYQFRNAIAYALHPKVMHTNVRWNLTGQNSLRPQNAQVDVELPTIEMPQQGQEHLFRPTSSKRGDKQKEQLATVRIFPRVPHCLTLKRPTMLLYPLSYACRPRECRPPAHAMPETSGGSRAGIQLWPSRSVGHATNIARVELCR